MSICCTMDFICYCFFPPPVSFSLSSHSLSPTPSSSAHLLALHSVQFAQYAPFPALSLRTMQQCKVV